MARVRSLSRQAAAPPPPPADQEPDQEPESDQWAVGSAGPDLREGPEFGTESEPAGAPTESRRPGAHSVRTRPDSRAGQDTKERTPGSEDRSLLETLWSAIVAVPTSVLSPPTTLPPAPPEAPTADPLAPAERPAEHPAERTGSKAAAPAIGIAAVPTAAQLLASADLRTDQAPTDLHASGTMTAPDAVPGLGLRPPTRAPSTNRTIWAGPRHAAPHDWKSTSALLTIETPASITDGGLLALRLVVGLTMAAHGAQKAFGAFGGAGLHATAADFASLGYQPGLLFALAAVVGELFGGLLLTVGLLTPLAAGGIIGVTINAMVAVNSSHGFFATTGGIELPLLLTGGAFALLLAGPGRYALDARIPFFNGAAVQCAAASVASFALLTSLAAHLL